jgi:hypothetical protein
MTKPSKPTPTGATPPGSTGRSARRGTAKDAGSAKGTTSTGPAARGSSPAGSSPAARNARPGGGATRPQSKKIVNKRQTPWGAIAASVIVVLLAVAVIGYAVAQNKKKSDASNPAKIAGIVHKTFAAQDHKNGVITYSEAPPFGGPHAPVWADCTGTVYPNQIASENAVHDLEHGAVWVTYKPGLPADQLDALTKLVAGKPYTLLTPYAGLKTNVSLQAWGYQLFVDSATDKRVKQFIDVLRQNPLSTPEANARCDNPAFKTKPSTPGHPTDS